MSNLTTDDKRSIIAAINQLVNAANITQSTASSNGILFDALLISLETGAGKNNFSKVVLSNDTINLPADCAWGIRTVYWLSPDKVCVQINGVTTDGNTSKIWSNCYNHGDWTGWN